MKRVRRTGWLVVVSAMTGIFLAHATPAQAHPLGNFTVNRFTELEISPGRIVLNYVVDLAEVPTFQERDAIDRDDDGEISSKELDVYADAMRGRLMSGFALAVDDNEADLVPGSAHAELSPGEGGLDVLRIECSYEADIPAGRVAIRYVDLNYSSLIGWKEVVARGTSGMRIAEATVPATSISDELRDYPDDLMSNPPQVDEAKIIVEPGVNDGDPGDATEGEPGGGFGDPLGRSFAGLVDDDLSIGVVLGALALAILFGAVHALGPGHGKTIMAAYLIGTGGRARHALAIGVAVSMMHTASVVALGLVTLGASSLFSPAAVYPWLSLASGVIVLTLGVWLLSTRLRRWDSTGSEDAHDHHHHHGDGHGHTHELAEGTRLFSRRGLGAVALSGGLLPSPSALVVLLGSVALERVAFGIALVAAFSVGLAGALTVVGLLVLRARVVAGRRLAPRSMRALPVLSAVAILAVGLFLTTRAVLTF